MQSNSDEDMIMLWDSSEFGEPEDLSNVPLPFREWYAVHAHVTVQTPTIYGLTVLSSIISDCVESNNFATIDELFNVQCLKLNTLSMIALLRYTHTIQDKLEFRESFKNGVRLALILRGEDLKLMIGL